jgi:hypothetical protein
MSHHSPHAHLWYGDDVVGGVGYAVRVWHGGAGPDALALGVAHVLSTAQHCRALCRGRNGVRMCSAGVQLRRRS